MGTMSGDSVEDLEERYKTLTQAFLERLEETRVAHEGLKVAQAYYNDLYDTLMAFQAELAGVESELRTAKARRRAARERKP